MKNYWTGPGVLRYRAFFSEVLEFMQSLNEVEAARTLMREAFNWSVMRWLAEKKKVRKAADTANDLLDELARSVKETWSAEVKSAYAELVPTGPKSLIKVPPYSGKISAEAKLFVKQVKQADDEAYSARMEAEATFDMAEKRLSTSMAREGTRQAIASWDLHEKAIEKAKTGIDTPSTAS